MWFIPNLKGGSDGHYYNFIHSKFQCTDINKKVVYIFKT
jgi:hypothetical protein